MLELVSEKPVQVGASPDAPTTIRLTGISKYYAGIRALEDVSVAFHAGEVHAVLGENGAGKSTLMGIMSGAVQPSAGEIAFGDSQVSPLSPEKAAALGIAISFQHPAILDDLSVLENLQVALPPSLFQRDSARVVARAALDAVGLHVPLRTRADALTVAQKHLLEIAKALAIRPKVLILDEPTASLDQDATDMLFGRVRELAEAGASVVYITHRMAEVRLIAQRVTVLRDGRVRGVARVDEISDAEVLKLIIGRTLGSAFPAKATAIGEDNNLSVSGLSGNGFSDVSFEAAPGQIIGVAGVAGNGQSEFMRALAGLQRSKGSVHLKGRPLEGDALVREAAFMPSDRHTEGLARSLTVRENATFASLERFARYGILSRREELAQVSATFGSLAVKAPGLEAPILSLSGGNQQKVVMSRALLSRPGLIVADEPTQGVDVGARAEIYRILREASHAGTPVVVNSSDASELEGLCDKVIVLSRGRVAETLSGRDVNEARIVAAAVGAATHIGDTGAADPRNAAGGWRHFLQSDNAPTVPLTIVTILLGLYIFGQNPNFLSSYNVANILVAATALGFVAMGQTMALLLGGIDLSVGPLAGFLVVAASFFINEDKSPGTVAVGFVLMFVCACLAGLINGVLIRFARFTAIAATLATYIGIQGLSFLLRDGPDGYIRADVVDIINGQLGPIPIAFLVLVGCAVAGEVVLRRSRPGWRLRALGCDQESARRIGVRIDRTYIGAFVLSALFTALGAVMLLAQLGVGDPRQGANYTLSSITAVVLGGTSLQGGRGTFIGTVLGALLLTEVLNAVAFLGLSQTYQYVFQGALILIAALIYSLAQKRVDA